MPHPPNVLFIMVDQWPGALLGAGHPVIQTPTLDHLARLGTAIRAPTLSVQSASPRGAA